VEISVQHFCPLLNSLESAPLVHLSGFSQKFEQKSLRIWGSTYVMLSFSEFLSLLFKCGGEQTLFSGTSSLQVCKIPSCV
jgi:hypothetical protein